MAMLLVAALFATVLAGSSPTSAQPADRYSCVISTVDDGVHLALSGHRGGSEHLRVNGKWVANVTGRSSVVVDAEVGDRFEVRLRGNGYAGPSGFHSAGCAEAPVEPPADGYACVLSTVDGGVLLELSGRRGGSEHLRVNGRWVAKLTARSSVVVDAMIGDRFEVRLRGNGYAGPSGFHSASCVVAPRALAPLEPADGVLFGAWPKSRATGVASSTLAVAAFESATNSRLDIVQTFNPPHQPAFNVDWANAMLDNDRLPLITWKVGPLVRPSQGDQAGPRVVAGEFDDQIRQRAAEARQIDGPFFSRLFHEMDGSYGREYDLDDPEVFVQYWRRVHAIFAEEGVVNAVWVWTPASFKASEASFYPGDDVVDWIGVDPYLWLGAEPVGPSSTSCNGNRQFQGLSDRIGGDFWDFADQHSDKPVMLAEWGVGWSDDGALRDRYFATVVEALDQHPNLKALVYFNSSPANSCDWTLTNGGNAHVGLDAYSELANTQRFVADTGGLIRGFGAR